jgi:hypothetical protein
MTAPALPMLETHACEVCGNAFVPSSGLKRTCSVVCLRQSRRERALARNAERRATDPGETVIVGRLVRETCAREDLVRAMCDNASVRRLCRELPKLYRPESLVLCPIVRVEFEWATIISHPGEGLENGLRKNWGRFLGFEPLRPTDEVHPYRMLYLYKPGNQYNERLVQRAMLKRRLPKHLRKHVNAALRDTQKDFVSRLPAEAEAVIGTRLKMTAVEFWRTCKGKVMLPRPTPARQLELF